MQMYFGDVSLCYSYSLAMALDAYGYDFKAEFLEAIMVMGKRLKQSWNRFCLMDLSYWVLLIWAT